MASKVILVGLSGVSSSGKTTLARLLRDILPNSFILHEDDFFWPDSQIPVKNGIQDWDCLEAIDLSKLANTLRYIKQHGNPPSDFISKEDQNPVGEHDVNQDVVEALKVQAHDVPNDSKTPRIAIMDGFLLYSQNMKEVRDLLDLKLFLRTDYQSAKSRREARAGYVTVEGFWEDPPGYVDDVVWPNYVKDHSFLFQNGDVEGQYDQQAFQDTGILPLPERAQDDVTATLKWAYSAIFKEIKPH